MCSRMIRTCRTFTGLGVLLFSVSCSEDGLAPPPDGPRTPLLDATAAPPGPLHTIALENGSLSIWPYTGVDFSGTPQDPINLAFTGQADPRVIRQALMSLDGNRTGFGMPAVYPFNCTWSDAIGDLQTGYSAAAGWVGSSIQLSCGTYGPVRFHVRLFEAGLVTMANAHFEVLIPGTADHQVLSWELAEQLVSVDMLRTGLLDAGQPVSGTGMINDAPFRAIPEQIYNALPANLKSLIGGPAGSVSTPVPIGTDGQASVFKMVSRPSGPSAGSAQSFVITYGQIIPRPFCADGPEFLLVEGPVSLQKSVNVSERGALTSRFDASGRLRLTPVDPSSGQPIGETYEAEVSDHQVTSFDDQGGRAEGLQLQTELPRNVSGHGQKLIRLKVGFLGPDKYRKDIDCTP